MSNRSLVGLVMISVNRRILIVDDNADIHNDFLKILGGSGKKSKADSQLNAIEEELFGNDEMKTVDVNTAVEYEIDSAYQGLDALKMIDAAWRANKPYSLIFMDVRMPPGIDGIETISRIWRAIPNVEIVICTAYSDYSFDEILSKLGSTDRLLFLTKPFDSIAVKQMALSLTRKWTLHEEARRQVQLLQNEIAQRKESEKQLHHLIHHDLLTGLANRNQLQISMHEAIEEAQKNKTRFALFFIDLDRFREVIDTLGYHHGDRLIRKISDRLSETFKPQGKVFCQGDGEFAVLLPRIVSKGHTARMAQRVRSAFEPQFDLDGLNLEIRPHVGIVLYPDHGSNIDALMRHADMTLLSARKVEHGYRFYAHDLNSFSPERLMLLSDLRKAINTDQLILYYQPIIDLKTRRVVGLEALARWPHLVHGFISPAEFIPLAERCGLIKSLTAWVLGEVAKHWIILKSRGYDFFISVNLTAHDIQNAHLPEMIRKVIGASDMPYDRIRLEISEKGVMLDPDLAIQTMDLVTKMGIQMAIDNFGTGYSSLAYLKSLPAREIKIDHSFVGEFESNPNDIAIVKSMIDLGHNLGVRVLASGVSSPFSLRKLTEINCDSLQGSIINGPAPIGELLLWLQDSEWSQVEPEPTRIAAK